VHYERRIVATALLAVVPIAVIVLAMVWMGDYSTKVRWTVVTVVALALFTATYVIHEQLTYPLRTVSNLITALREEDYSLRARHPRRDDALGDVLAEINSLSNLMESRKLEAVEATALLRAVLAEIDAAIFAFDDRDRLRLINRAGEKLLDAPATRVEGATANELGLADLLADDAPHAVERTFPGGSGRWDVRHSSFREQGAPHRLLVVADISRALREEETEAWRRIVRVIGHELNNSLAPIKSISASIEQLVTREPLPSDWREDFTRGMRVIGSRTEALTRFTRAYTQLARLPEPRKRDVRIGDLVRRVTALETRVRVETSGDANVVVSADEDQLEQLLINIVRNAAEASLATGGGVRVRWRARREDAEILVEDEGAGLSATANLFVPFFTTKPGGTGVGLVLSRQIAEAHGGSLTLENRREARGCVARLTLPR
jgi:two-component system, NtrC family, nitrogen regulation sensor histidine kinase NtrY